MNTFLDFLSLLSMGLFWAVVVGPPWLIFGRPSKKGPPILPLRFLMSVLVVWAGVILHRILIGLPLAQASARARGNLEYDGLLVNGMTLLFGWGIGFIGAALAWLAADEKMRKQKNEGSATL